jgi:hypothetical protein
MADTISKLLVGDIGLRPIFLSPTNNYYLTDPLLKDMDWTGIIKSLTKHSNILTKLHIIY